jgi:hypothetical protein
MRSRRSTAVLAVVAVAAVALLVAARSPERLGLGVAVAAPVVMPVTPERREPGPVAPDRRDDAAPKARASRARADERSAEPGPSAQPAEPVSDPPAASAQPEGDRGLEHFDDRH